MSCQFANHLIPTCYQRDNDNQLKTSQYCEICRLRKKIGNPSNQRRKQRRQEARQGILNHPGPSSNTPMVPEQVSYQSRNTDGMIINYMRRDTWRRPCAIGASQILIGDSQIRRLSKPLGPGSLQISYSGADPLGKTIT